MECADHAAVSTAAPKLEVEQLPLWRTALARWQHSACSLVYIPKVFNVLTLWGVGGVLFDYSASGCRQWLGNFDGVVACGCAGLLWLQLAGAEWRQGVAAVGMWLTLCRRWRKSAVPTVAVHLRSKFLVIAWLSPCLVFNWGTGCRG